MLFKYPGEREEERLAQTECRAERGPQSIMETAAKPFVVLPKVIPSSIDQNPFAHFRVAMDMIFQG